MHLLGFLKRESIKSDVSLAGADFSAVRELGELRAKRHVRGSGDELSIIQQFLLRTRAK